MAGSGRLWGSTDQPSVRARPRRAKAFTGYFFRKGPLVVAVVVRTPDGGRCASRFLASQWRANAAREWMPSRR